ncbi:hypothetical protein HPB50_004355 [Hyalomma asiaticum]|uniref:Uncharacterized protein n=1 Tax=Hyalomma asiaticum TaxID=266040 RepID=A0ACB7T626_HYAAI|nr:hypothetical protein HPB50_004355 [Hyalomma asiaticum]
MNPQRCPLRDVPDPMSRTPKPKTTKYPKGTYLPGQTTQVLQTWKTLVEVLATEKRIFDADCLCMDSEHYQDFGLRNFVRTMSCSKLGSFGSVLIMFELDVEDDTVLLRLTRYGDGIAALPFGIPSRLDVLYASGECIVLEVPRKKGEPPMCSMWGPRNESGVDEELCYKIFFSDCKGTWSPSYQVQEDRCSLHRNLASGKD